jgi:hypothetical protein
VTVGVGPARGPLPELSGLHRRAHEAAWHLRPAGRQAASCGSRAPSIDRGAAFHVQILLAQLQERSAPPGRSCMLAAYRAHLAERIRYFGPLRPVDLRV